MGLLQEQEDLQLQLITQSIKPPTAGANNSNLRHCDYSNIRTAPTM